MTFNSQSFHWWNASNETFCGRKDVIEIIDAGLDRGDSFSVLGQRGMGKSMLLSIIKERRMHIGNEVLCLNIQITGRESEPFDIIDNIRNVLLKEISQSVKSEEASILLELKNINRTMTSPILKMVNIVRAKLGRPIAVELLIDDFHRISSQNWVKDLVANLEFELFSDRSHANKLRAVFFGDIRMKNLLEVMPFSDIWQRLRNIWLQNLTDDEVEELLSDCENIKCIGNPHEIAKNIGTKTGGHPSITQYLLRDLFEKSNSEFETSLERSASRFINELSKMLQAIWEQIGNEACTLVQLIAKSEKPITSQQLQKELTFSSRKYSKILNTALTCGFVRSNDKGNISIGSIFSKWVSFNSTEEKIKKNSHVSGFLKNQLYDFPTILHISDLHFGKDGHAWDNAKEIPGVDRPAHDKVTLIDSIINSLEVLKNKNEKLWPGVVLISGDFLFQCDKESVSEVVEFLNQLVSKLKIDKSAIAMCPGNHEQNRKILSEEPKAQLSCYRDIWNLFYSEDFKRLPLEWSPGKYTHVYKLDKIEILSLNSCEDLDPALDKSGIFAKEQGYIGKKQLSVAEKLLGSEMPPDNCIRVAILHHHLSQYRFSVDIDYSILREVERVIEWLRKWNIDIVFHGHQHCPGLQTRLVDRKFLTIIAGGSLGVTSKFRYGGGGMPLMYQLVYPNSKNCAERLCQTFDLYDETWIPSRQIKIEEIPLGYQNKP